MQPTPNYLTSPTLTFDRDGARLISVENDGIEITDIMRRDSVRIEQAKACAAVGFADQIWVASADECIYRYTPTGTQIGESMILPFAEHPMFVTAPCGPPAALWGDSALHSEGTGAQLVCTSLPPTELALPITHRRFAISAWRKLLMPSGVAARFDAAITGGAVLADGSQAVVVLGSGTSRELALVSLTDGRAVKRLSIPAGIVRLARSNGLVVVLTDPRTLLAIDVRSGQALATIQLARPTRDLAIDPMGRTIALRSDRVEWVAMTDLLRWSATTTQPLRAAV